MGIQILLVSAEDLYLGFLLKTRCLELHPASVSHTQAVHFAARKEHGRRLSPALMRRYPPRLEKNKSV